MILNIRRLKLSSALALLLSSGCTTLHQVSVGPNPDEFYAVAQRSVAYFLPGPSYILHCTEIKDPLGVELVCERVLSNTEAGMLAPAKNPVGREKFVRSKKAQ